MPITIASQAHIFLVSVAGGIVAAFIYDLMRIRRKTIHACSILVHLEDILFWILTAIIFFLLAYYSNDGEIRGFMFIGAAIGAILYILTLSKIIIKIFVTVINCVVIVVKKISSLPVFLFGSLIRHFKKIFRIKNG